MCLPPYDWMSGIPPPPSTHFSGLIRPSQVHGRSRRLHFPGIIMYVLSSISQSGVIPLYMIYRIVPGDRKTLATRPASGFPLKDTSISARFFYKICTHVSPPFFFQNKGFDFKTC